MCLPLNDTCVFNGTESTYASRAHNFSCCLGYSKVMQCSVPRLQSRRPRVSFSVLVGISWSTKISLAAWLRWLLPSDPCSDGSVVPRTTSETSAITGGLVSSLVLDPEFCWVNFPTSPFLRIHWFPKYSFSLHCNREFGA